MDTPTTYRCPKCGFESSDFQSCEACGALFEKVRRRRLNEEITELAMEDSPYQQPDTRPHTLPLWQKTLVLAVLLLIGLSWALNSRRQAGPGVGDMVTFSSAMAVDGRPAVVKFYADWCGPCKVYAPIFDKVTGEYGSRIKAASVNLDENRDVAQRYSVRAIPATLFFDAKGNQVRRIDGVVSDTTLKSAIDELF